MSSDDNLSMSVLFPSEFLRAEDLQGRQVTVQIVGVSRDAVPMTNGKKEPATVLRLAKTKKKIICNKTNGYALALLLSPNLAAPSGRDWIGKRVTLCADVDQRGKEEVAAIRVAGSPDAAEDRSASYARAWRGERKGGALCSRLRRAVAIGAVRGHAPPVDRDEPEREPEQAQHERDEVFGGAEREPGSDG